MQKKIIATILVSILILFYIFDPQQTNVWNASVKHLNVFHLILNSVTLYSLYTSQLNNFKPYIIIPSCYLIAVIAFYVSDDVAIGASGAILALFGFIVSKNINKHNLAITAIVIALSFLPGIATTVHLVAILLSMLVGLIVNAIIYIGNHV